MLTIRQPITFLQSLQRSTSEVATRVVSAGVNLHMILFGSLLAVLDAFTTIHWSAYISLSILFIGYFTERIWKLNKEKKV